MFDGPDGGKWFSHRDECAGPACGRPKAAPVDPDAEGRIHFAEPDRTPSGDGRGRRGAEKGAAPGGRFRLPNFSTDWK